MNPTTAPLRTVTGAAVQTRGLTKVHTATGAVPVTAVDQVDLDVSTGSFVAVMGPSGSGKSSLLQCAAGLDRPSSGTVRIAGTDLGDLDEDELARLRRREISFVFQAYNLVPTLTVVQNVGLPARLDGRRPDRAAVERLVMQVGLADRRDHLPGMLSGGQQQRVAIARALLGSSSVIFADEPTGALDTSSAHDVLRLLRDAVDSTGRTVLMVTHDPVAAAVADDVVFMANGRIADRITGAGADRIGARMTALTESTQELAC